MSLSVIDPVHWTPEALRRLGSDLLLELAKKSSAVSRAYRLVVGRCLLAIRDSRLYQSLGYSSEIHYATSALGLSKKEACELRRVAAALESLPQLTRAAELGQVAWGRLREIVRVATVDTEEVWLKLSGRYSDKQIEDLVRGCERGQLPWQTPEPSSSERRWVLSLDAEGEVLFDRLAQVLSEKAGRPLSLTEALRLLAEQELAQDSHREGGAPSSVRRARQEAHWSAQARRRRRRLLVDSAREAAQAWGLEQAEARDDDQLLALALGAEAHELEDPDEAEPQVRPARVGPESETRPARVELAEAAESLAEVPPCETVTLDSERFRQLVASGTLAAPETEAESATGPEPWDWQNRRLRFNPQARLATPAQRREVLRRDGHRCCTPGCPHRMWLHLHHTVFYSRRGDTVRANLVTLCSRCHRHLHQGTLRLDGQPDSGALTFRDAQGRDLAKLQTVELASWLNLHLGWPGEEDDFTRPQLGLAG